MLRRPTALGCRVIGRKERVFSLLVSDQKNLGLCCFCTCNRSYARSASLEAVDFEDSHHPVAQTGIAAYGSLLRSCGDEKAWKDGMVAHHHIMVHGFAHDGFLRGLLVQMYGKCGSLDHALNVFNAMPEHSAFSWNFIIRASTEQGHYQEAIELFHQMQQEGTSPDRFTYVCALTVCSGKGDLSYSMQMHARIVDSSIEFDTAVGTAVVKMYGNCGKVHDAELNFEKMIERDVVSWNVMLAIYAENHQIKEALQLFCHIQQQGHLPTSVSFLSMLDACAIWSLLVQGKRVHVCISSVGTEIDSMVENALVNMYGKCCLQRANTIFQLVRARNVVTWTTMIASCTQHGQSELAFHLFDQMCQEGVLPDKVTYLEILAACVNSVWLSKGESLVARLTGVADDVVMTEVINMYGRCGGPQDARKVFDRVSSRGIVAWNTMISVYSQCGEADEAFQLFAQLLSKVKIPTSVTFVSMLGACMKFFEGRTLHAFIIESNYDLEMIMGNAIISMYGRNTDIEDAWSTFTKMARRDVISWNAMLAAYVSEGRLMAAHSLFEQMVQEGIQPDRVTYTTLLEGYAHHEMPSFNDLLDGSDIDGERPDTGSVVISNLSKHSVLHNSWRLFNEMHERDVRTWNAMINIHAHQSEETGPFFLFSRMFEESFLPNNDSFISMISACTGERGLFSGKRISACTGERGLFSGKRIHSCVTSCELEADFAVGTALVMMYGNLGHVETRQGRPLIVSQVRMLFYGRL